MKLLLNTVPSWFPLLASSRFLLERNPPWFLEILVESYFLAESIKNHEELIADLFSQKVLSF